MKNLRLRTKLLAIALPPMAILALLVAYTLKITALDPQALDVATVHADLRALGLVGLAGVLASALVLVLVTRDVVGPLDRLTQAADELSQERLPALVEVLRDPTATLPPPTEPLDRGTDDELGRLARALDGVQAVAAEVAATQQGLVHHGLSTLVVNVARRSQTLLERQLALIDELETAEHDPARLEDLYRLDHLATRMRRNAESLLVLSGAPPPRRRGEPVPLADVLRVATGEIEDYRRVELGDVDDVELATTVAVDLAHLLAELLDNATQFSPPDAAVLVEGRAALDGSYRITVADRGIGMVDEQRLEANQRLAHPPALGLDVSRSLGFVVVGRLAQRLGVAVALAPSAPQGLTAVVDIPAGLVVVTGAPRDWTPPVAASDPAAAPGSGPSATGPRPPVDPRSWWAHPSQPGRTGPPTGPAGPEPSGHLESPHHLADALPFGEAFDEGLRGLIAPGSSAAPAPIEPPVTPLVRRIPERGLEEGSPPRPAEPTADPVDPLTPGADDAVGPVGPERFPAESTVAHRDGGLTRRQRGSHAPAAETGRTAGPSSRSPEEIREMLARYRRGIKHRRPTTGTADEEATP